MSQALKEYAMQTVEFDELDGEPIYKSYVGDIQPIAKIKQKTGKSLPALSDNGLGFTPQVNRTQIGNYHG